jgi:monofunctional chorismate mutase
MDKLLEVRTKIDKIDNQIMELLDQRYDLSIEVGNIKKETKSLVFDSNREEIILNKTSKLRHSHAIKTVYTSIMKESKNIQRK